MATSKPTTAAPSGATAASAAKADLEVITNAIEARGMFAECAGGNVMGWRRNLTGGRFAWVVFAEGQTEGPLDALEWSFGVYDAEGGDESVVDAVTFAGAMAEADADV